MIEMSIVVRRSRTDTRRQLVGYLTPIEFEKEHMT